MYINKCNKLTSNKFYNKQFIKIYYTINKINYINLIKIQNEKI